RKLAEPCLRTRQPERNRGRIEQSLCARKTFFGGGVVLGVESVVALVGEAARRGAIVGVLGQGGARSEERERREQGEVSEQVSEQAHASASSRGSEAEIAFAVGPAAADRSDRPRSARGARGLGGRRRRCGPGRSRRRRS